MNDNDNVRQLLTEIRDCQRELLAQQREALNLHRESAEKYQEALARQKKLLVPAIFCLFLLLPALIAFLVLILSR